MSLKLKYFTIEEAEKLIPQITIHLEKALETKLQIEKKVDDWRKAHKSMNEIDEALLRGQVDFLASQLEQELGKITELGGVPKDLDLGLVDFPARIESKEAYLCWRMGETRIDHWHGLTEGFQGRKSLKREV